MKKLPLALCISAIIATTSSYANSNDNGKKRYYKSDGKSSVELDKRVKVSKYLTYKGKVRIGGYIKVKGLGMAVVENKQVIKHNEEKRRRRGPATALNSKSKSNQATNYYHKNKSTITNDAFDKAKGNIGVNMADGDHNLQSNNAAIASIDSYFAFGSGDAEIFSKQRAHGNKVRNYGSSNVSLVDDHAFGHASGNIGLNITSGNNNIQANNLALSSYGGRLGEASISNKQKSDRNYTMNSSAIENTKHEKGKRITLGLGALGKYGGTSTLQDGFYPEIWLDDGEHNNGPALKVGHLDFDSETPTGGKMTFKEKGGLVLGGVVTGYIPTYVKEVFKQSKNVSTLDHVFKHANGNIGVNISAGSGNLQSNNLAVSSMNAAGEYK